LGPATNHRRLGRWHAKVAERVSATATFIHLLLKEYLVSTFPYPLTYPLMDGVLARFTC
jgi:hypothetical protein